MISIEDRRKIFLAIEKSKKETEKEINDDCRGFFNARTSVDVLCKKITTEMILLFNEINR